MDFQSHLKSYIDRLTTVVQGIESKTLERDLSAEKSELHSLIGHMQGISSIDQPVVHQGATA